MLICCHLFLPELDEMRLIRNLCMSLSAYLQLHWGILKLKLRMGMDMISPLGLDRMRSQHMLFECNSSTVKDKTATSRENLLKHLCCLAFDLTCTASLYFISWISPWHSRLIFYLFLKKNFPSAYVHVALTRLLAGIPGGSQRLQVFRLIEYFTDPLLGWGVFYL